MSGVVMQRGVTNSMRYALSPLCVRAFEPFHPVGKLWGFVSPCGTRFAVLFIIRAQFPGIYAIDPTSWTGPKLAIRSLASIKLRITV